jgi:hypothetical protein
MFTPCHHQDKLRGKRNSVIVPAGTKITFIDRETGAKQVHIAFSCVNSDFELMLSRFVKQVLELGISPKIDDIQDKLKIAFDLFEKDVFLFVDKKVDPPPIFFQFSAPT